MNDETLSSTQATAFLKSLGVKVSAKGLCARVRDGFGPVATLIPGRRPVYLFKRESLVDWAKTHCVSTPTRLGSTAQ